MLSPAELSSLGGVPSLRIARPAAAGAQAFAALRHAIVTLRLRPGQSFSEQEVARQLRISRTPVREAFIKLAEAGLIEVLPQRGTLVRRISVKAVRDARFVREAVETAVLREAAGRLPSLRPRRGARPDRGPARGRAGDDLGRFLGLDDAFHRSFAAGIDRGHAWAVVEAQKAQMDRVRFLSLPRPRRSAG
jgi:DNA-binding GntR family transcriptional regulator